MDSAAGENGPAQGPTNTMFDDNLVMNSPLRKQLSRESWVGYGLSPRQCLLFSQLLSDPNQQAGMVYR